MVETCLPFCLLVTGKLCYACLPLIFEEFFDAQISSVAGMVDGNPTTQAKPSVRNNARDSNKFKL